MDRGSEYRVKGAVGLLIAVRVEAERRGSVMLFLGMRNQRDWADNYSKWLCKRR